MPRDKLAESKRRLSEVYALLDALSADWKDGLALVAQCKIAGEHVQLALTTLGQAEDLISIRQEAKGQ